MHARNFLDQYFDKDGNQKRPIPDTKFTVRHDKWDMEDYNAIVTELKELGNAEDDLAAFVSTGGPAMADMFFGLSKAKADLRPEDEIRPSYMVNRAVLGEAFNLKEYEELRVHTAGDIVSAAMGCVAVEPELEILFDKVDEETKLAEQLEQQMQQMEGLAGDLADAEEMMNAAAAGEGDQEGEGDYQKQQEKIKEAMKKLREEMGDTADAIDKGLKEKIPELKEQAKKVLDTAKQQGENLDSLSSTWGLDAGQLSKLPPQRRIELANRMNNDKFKRIAELLGPLVRLAFAEQQKKTIHAREEMHDVKMGNDLANVLPIEMLLMGDPDMDVVFWDKYVEHKLMQYEMKGSEKLAKGGILWCEDGSGSMYGDNEVWAKACGLALLQVAHMQKRDFFGIHFGSPGEYKTFDFELDGGLETNYKGTIEKFDRIDGVINFAECFFNGGTDFHTPLTVALDRLRADYEKHGEVKADIVFCTDGQCGVDETFMKELKEEQARLGFRIWGIVLGGMRDMEPLNTICDGRVFTISDIVKGGDNLRDMFRSI